jgi:hypothetical protein
MAGGRLLPVCRWLPVGWTQRQGERMKRIRPIFIFSLTLATAALLAACGGPRRARFPSIAPADGITIMPTATRQADPNLFIPPSPA